MLGSLLLVVMIVIVFTLEEEEEEVKILNGVLEEMNCGRLRDQIGDLLGVVTAAELWMVEVVEVVGREEVRTVCPSVAMTNESDQTLTDASIIQKPKTRFP